MKNSTIRQAILSGAESVSASLNLEVGEKVNDKGEVKPLYAKCRVDGSPKNREEAVANLAKMDVVNVSLPTIGQGERCVLRLSSKMTGVRLHCLFVACCGYERNASITDAAFNAHMLAMNLPTLPTIAPTPTVVETVPPAVKVSKASKQAALATA